MLIRKPDVSAWGLNLRLIACIPPGWWEGERPQRTRNDAKASAHDEPGGFKAISRWLLSDARQCASLHALHPLFQ